MNRMGTLHLKYAVLTVVLGIWGIGTPLALQEATSFEISFGDVLALSGFITGPPTLLVVGMWHHLNKQLAAVRADMAELREHVAEICP